MSYKMHAVRERNIKFITLEIEFTHKSWNRHDSVADISTLIVTGKLPFFIQVPYAQLLRRYYSYKDTTCLSFDPDWS
jgi:hypothetical protein